MKRNPAATCSTCPYFYSSPTLRSEDSGVCRRRCRTELPRVNHKWWCGEHPDFFTSQRDSSDDDLVKATVEIAPEYDR